MLQAVNILKQIQTSKIGNANFPLTIPLTTSGQKMSFLLSVLLSYNPKICKRWNKIV